MLARLGLSTPITATTPIDEEIITADALFEACTSHWRKMASSSPLFKIDMREYFRRFEPELSTPLAISTKLACVWCPFTAWFRMASRSLLEIDLLFADMVYRRRNDNPSALACTKSWLTRLLSFLASFPSSPHEPTDTPVHHSASALDDVSLASWWSVVDVKSVDLDRKNSFAHLVPSDTYVKAWYKLKELEVALCSACLTTDQVRHPERCDLSSGWFR